MPPATTYDDVLYPSHPFQQTHPARTAAVARLHGVAAARPTKCRVLELGCGDGANVIPMAAAYPDSEFVGLDLAPTPVEKGNRDIAALGLKNIKLYAADICTAGDEFGKFDYVTAHGVFSWVPDVVREAILDLCRRQLTPNGVAYISYNALPGCYFRKVFWDVLKFHTQSVEDTQQKIKQARAVLHFLSEGIPETGSLSQYMRMEAKHMAFERHDALLYHDDLSPANKPFYFHEFAAMAGRYGLKFLSEADFSESENDVFPPGVAERLRQLGEMDVVYQEQYRDYLRLRRFRQTLLVRGDVDVTRPVGPAAVLGCQVAFETRPDVTDPDLSPGVKVKFRVKEGAAVTLDHPVAKAALAGLADRWPHPATFDAAVADAEAKIGRPATAADREVVAEVILAGFGVGMLHLFVDPPKTVLDPGDKPRLCPVVRHQIETGQEVLTNRLHVPVKIDEPLTRRLLWCMNGERDRDAIVGELSVWAEAELAKQPGDAPKKTAAELKEEFAGQIDAGYAKAAELALLV